MSDLVVYEAQLEKEAKSIAEYSGEEAKKYILATKEDYAEAGDIVNQCATRLKELDNIERSMTAGAYQTIEAIKDRIRPFKAEAQDGLRLWKGKMKDFITAQELQQEEVRKQLQAAVQKQDSREVKKGLAKLEEKPKTEGIQERKIWKWKVLNRDIVPTIFTSVDSELVTAEMRKQLAEGNNRPYIAGIEFYQETTIAATGGR